MRQASAVAVALSVVEAIAPGHRNLAMRLRKKLEAAVGDVPVRVAVDDPPFLDDVRDAVEHHERIRIEYVAGTAGTRIVVIVDADLGGVRIARRVLEAALNAEIVDVGRWPHPERSPFLPNATAAKGLRALSSEPLVGSLRWSGTRARLPARAGARDSRHRAS